LVANRAASAGGPALATLLGTAGGELPAAGRAAGDPDAAQQVQGRLRMLVGPVGLIASASGSDLASLAARYSLRTSSPVSVASMAGSIQCTASGVAMTQTCHPAAWASFTSSCTSEAGGAAQTTT
jgi:hypothetical protein